MLQNILIIGVVGAWFAAAVVGGLAGFFSEPGVPPERLGLFVVIPFLGFSLAYFLSTSFRMFALSRSAEVSAEDNYTSTWQNDGEIKFVQLKNGISLRYLEIGTGMPLILLHTLRTQLDYFQRLVPLLKNHFHIYAIDLPGHGRSSLVQNAVYDELFFRQSIVAFIKELDLKNVMLVGESIGAVLALTVASEMSDRISHVYAFNPYDYGEKFGGGIRRSKYGYILSVSFGSSSLIP